MSMEADQNPEKGRSAGDGGWRGVIWLLAAGAAFLCVVVLAGRLMQS